MTTSDAPGSLVAMVALINTSGGITHKSPSPAGDRGWQSIGRALKVLELIGAHSRAVSLTDVAAEAELTISTAHRILKGLETRGFVLRDPLLVEYSVGPSILRLARAALEQNIDGDLVLLAFPAMQRLRKLTTETVGLHVVQGNNRICVGELPSHQPIRVASGVGASHALGVSAPGKAMLAFQSDKTIEQVMGSQEFKKASINRQVTPSVQQTLEAIRIDGYATSFGETVPGASAIAVPVIDSQGIAYAAINVTGPHVRWTLDKMLEHLPAIRESVNWLERHHGVERSAERTGNELPE